MRQLYKILFLIYTMFIPGHSFANAPDSFQSSDNIAIYGTACEDIKDDFKSSVRVRVTDKASFLAISTIPDLVDFRKNMTDHDFNVMVYAIVDDMIEDMTVKTLKQDEEEICVEMTGSVKNDNIYKAVSDHIEAKAKEPTLDLEPKTKEISTTTETVVTTTTTTKTVVEKVEPQNLKSLVYVPPLTFYNNTRSSQHTQIIKNLFLNNSQVELTTNPDEADYIVKAKVLRAKVEQINQESSRLQMIISIELEITRDNSVLTANQNRFVLFSKDDNEQEVASNLMRNLLEKAGRSILSRVEKDSSLHKKSDTSGAIITPASGTIRVIKD